MVSSYDPNMQRRHKWRNRLHSALLLIGMTMLLGACGWILFGQDSAIWIVVGSVVGFAIGPSMSPEWVMRVYGARLLTRQTFAGGIDLLDALAARAGLAVVPRLYYIPSRMMNAFAVGKADNAAIAITDGMLRALDWRELAGVLAHELSHVRSNDLWIMGLADAMSRLTSLLSFLGVFLLVASLPLALMGREPFSLVAALLLIFAPTIGSLLQLALSRSREHDADLDAAGLTRDPAGLALALAKLERRQGRYWEEIFLPGRRMPEPSLLRSHPPTEERIRRLMALAGPTSDIYGEQRPVETGWPPFTASPRFKRLGFWY